MCLLLMTVLVDTYEMPAHAIMAQLYSSVCYEVLPEEVYAKASHVPREGKKYTFLQDINPQTLLALRDIEHVIYVFHREMLSEREYSIIKHYTNELVCVEDGVLKVVNRKTRKEAEYEIASRRSAQQIEHQLRKVERAKGAEARAPQLTEEQQRAKSASLPYLQAQGAEEVYFPEEEESG